MKSKDLIIFGEMGSGKDSVFEIFKCLGDYKKAKIGKYIRENVDDYTELLNLPKNERRKRYVNYGEGMKKIFAEDIWNYILFRDVQDDLFTDSYIIADARRENELEFWMEKEFVPIAIISDRDKRRQRLIERDGYDQIESFDDPTEVQARKCIEKIKILAKEGKGYVIENNRTIEDLIEQIKKIYDQIQEIEKEEFFNRLG